MGGKPKAQNDAAKSQKYLGTESRGLGCGRGMALNSSYL